MWFILFCDFNKSGLSRNSHRGNFWISRICENHKTEWTTLLIQSYDWLRSFTTSVHSLTQTLYMQSFQIPTVGIHVQTNSESKRKWHFASGSSLLYSSRTVSNNSNAHKEDRLHEWKNPAGGCRLQIPTVGIWKARGNNRKVVYPLLCFIITGFM